MAHDDPVLTVRVLCQGLTDGQIDTAMGEVDDNARINVDRPVNGRQQIIDWMQQQLSLNLRIEVVDVTPTQTADGYEVTWTTHMYREDWRKAGVPMRQTTEHASIHNGRITQWTSSLASQAAVPGTGAAAQQRANAQQPANAAANSQQPANAAAATSRTTAEAVGPTLGGVPLSQVPIGIIGLVLLLGAAGGWLLMSMLRRPRTTHTNRQVASIEALAPRAPERKP
jgi:hypothetical protein